MNAGTKKGSQNSKEAFKKSIRHTMSVGEATFQAEKLTLLSRPILDFLLGF
jgi:hypothetical protein